MGTKYDSSNIETLRFPENIRRNTSMYLGSTDAHGRWLIARELLDNGLDEGLAGRNKGNVFVECVDGSYWVIDFGNGIPQGVKTITVNVNGENVKSNIPTMQAIFSEMHTSGKFRSEAYQVSVGCFTGDTKIRLLDGRSITFENLYNEWVSRKEPIDIMTWDVVNDRVAYSKITHVQLSKYTRQLIEVDIDGKLVRCTPDHPFYVRTENGIKTVEAKDLRTGDSLVSMRLSTDSDGYLYSSDLTRNNSTMPRKLHRSVYAFYNHSVCNVRGITLDDPVPVYGMTVDKYHTYFVEPGVLVKNTHGVGAKGTNATSEFFEVFTNFEGSWYTIGFERGILKTPVTKLRNAPKGPFGKPLTKGTAIHFKPDAKIFDKKSTIDLAYVKQWAEITSYLTPGFTVLVVDKKKNRTKYYSEKGATEYVAKLLTELKAEAERVQFEFHNDICDVVVAFSTAEACNIRGYTNGLFNSEGGKHVDSVIACLYDSAKQYIRGKQSFSIHNFKEGLVGLVNMKLHKAEFSSQDKSRLTDLRAGTDFRELLQKETDKFFASNKALALRLCDKASKLSQLMDKFKASKKVVSALNAVKRKGLPAKYAPFDTKTKIEDRELLIVEGDSAAGGLREERMPWQSLLPLKGKILNCARPGKQDKSLESEEIINILGAIGYDPKAPDPLSKLQVSKVICLADADPDGPLREDTYVFTNKGPMRIIDIVAEYEKGIDYYNHPATALSTYSWDKERQKVVLSEINWAGLTCIKDVTVEIVFEELTNDRLLSVKCSESHKWLRRNDYDREKGGTWITASEVQVNDLLAGVDANKNLCCYRVYSITKKRTPDQRFYCLDIQHYHNFIVCNSKGEHKVISHNCHINTLLLTLFHTYLPGMFERGMVYVADMPEFYSLYKDQFFSGSTVSEVRKKMDRAKVPTSVEINHIKGWGEIDASLMRILAIDPNTRRLIRIEPVSDSDRVTFTKLMSEDVQFRRELLGLSENV